MRVALMIEGQEDVTWQQWVDLAHAAEAAGLHALFRSDHYGSVAGRQQRGSLDAWATISALAAATDTLRFGTLVSPASFRHPSVLAKQAVTADHVSGGRVTLGMGAGWHDDEHAAYGFPFHDVGTRMAVFEEQVEIVVRQQTEQVFSFAGEHYELTDCRALPEPVQEPRMPLIIGGLAGPRSCRIAAAWADEYNTVFASPEQARERREHVAAACEDAERDTVRFSVMTGCLLARDGDELRDRGRRLMEWSGEQGDVDAWLDGLREQWIIGTPEQAAARLQDYAAAGVDGVMLQHQLHWDTDMVGLIGALA